MDPQSIKTSFRLLLAKCLIRFKRLKHVDYSVEDISQLIEPHLPISFPISVPRGDGRFTLSQAKITMPYNGNYIQAELLGGIEVTYLGNPIYRAHVILVVRAKPHYEHNTKNVLLTEISITDIHMLNDEYAILKDTSNLISLFVPSPVLSMVAGTMKTAFNIMTGTTASEANRYLQVYLSGSKQKVLDYHKPQIENIIIELAASEDMQYSLDKTNFEEGLFIQYGKKVVVEEGHLRFKF
ncbi:hypothetical protein [Paraglaciecola arctica]|uniref:DUF1439 domain-containing protein n=1 Tax=Paraglaciecola arctica BSs20135 TaxID=493475 RepID=K6Z2M8_9ALTE|nr:hypothetical protein [Paraglaciecola arctica]GAC17715.1 hypothetical protein GARC_0734 [Paraglaciecola arctica BSs20135]